MQCVQPAQCAITKEHTMKAIILALALAGLNAQAMKIDDGKGDATYRIDGKEVSATDATVAAIKGQVVFKCKGKAAGKGKVYFAANGSRIAEVVECSPMEAVLNAKGGVKLKAVK